MLPAPPRPLRAPPPFRGFCCPLPATAGKCAAAAGPGRAGALRTLQGEQPALYQNRLPKQHPAGRSCSFLPHPPRKRTRSKNHISAGPQNTHPVLRARHLFNRNPDRSPGDSRLPDEHRRAKAAGMWVYKGTARFIFIYAYLFLQ